MSDITIYTTPTCGYCKMTKSFLQSKDLTYKEVDISTDQSGLEWVANATGQLGTPVTKIGDKIIIGFDRISLEEAIKEL